jgi:hypothetical protein
MSDLKRLEIAWAAGACDELTYIDALIDKVAELEAELAQRDAMLRLAWHDAGWRRTTPVSEDDWLADLRRRVE